MQGMPPVTGSAPDEQGHQQHQAGARGKNFEGLNHAPEM